VLALDNTILPTLGSIATQQASTTEKSNAITLWLMNNVASNPEAKIRYHASNMTLYIYSDISYLSQPKARSRVGGFFCLSEKLSDPTKPPTVQPPRNSAIHGISKMLCSVVGSAAEAEIGTAYLNVQKAVPIATTLDKLGHTQGRIPLQVNNITSSVFTNNTIKKWSKAIDNSFYWLQDCMGQG